MANVQQLRKSYVTMHLPASPAAGVSQSTFLAGHPMRLEAAQLCLSDGGAGAGGTTVTVKVNGVAVATGLTVAVGAATLATKVTANGAVNNYPGGARLNTGDVVTVDVTAVPSGAAPKSAAVILALTQLDT